jgi:hypothetical protein
MEDAAAMSLCLTAGAFALSLAGQALHLEWTGADGIARAESWIVQDRRLVLVAARVKSGNTVAAGADGALRVGDWWHHWPQRPPQDRLTIANSSSAGYRLCWNTGCADLDFLLPRDKTGAPVVIASCFPPN